jgi:DNA processing protein
MEIDDHFVSALTRAGKLSAADLDRLLRTFGSAENIWRASASALSAAGLKPKAVQELISSRPSIDPDREKDLLLREGVSVVRWRGCDYPPLLARIADPPAALFVRGDPAAICGDHLIAVVGTRAITRYGEQVTALLCRPLAANLTIVSGLALGVDALAHAVALDAGGKTAAVLGSGVDRQSVGPRSNFGLAERIVADGGALVSEYPPGTAARRHHFPLRNRIIAGLCRGTVVIEAASRSGALITASAALEYNRDVFAVPGPINQAASEGTNALIGQGAIPITSAKDIFDHYDLRPIENLVSQNRRQVTDINKEGAAIVAALRDGPLAIDILAQKTGLRIRTVMAAATDLELAGIIAMSGNEYTLRFDSRGQVRLFCQT